MNHNLPVFKGPDRPDLVISSSLFCYIQSVLSQRDPSIGSIIDGRTGNALTYREAISRALCLAHGLKRHADGQVFKRGTTALIFGQNTTSYPILVLACSALGMTMSLANFMYTASELEWQYKDSRADVVLVSEALTNTAIAALKACGLTQEEAQRKVWVIGELFDFSPKTSQPVNRTGTQRLADFLGYGEMNLNEVERFDGRDAEEIAIIPYSSGTSVSPSYES
jgi:acyl-CoA synthetase (AMP-forming)/AMP-acid ligase II